MNAVKSYIETALRIAEKQYEYLQYKPEETRDNIAYVKLYALIFGLKSLLVLFDD